MVDSNAARQNNPTKEYLMGLEDKPLMDEFVALYIGLTSNDKLERQFRESLNVSLITLLSYFVVKHNSENSLLLLILAPEWTR